MQWQCNDKNGYILRTNNFIITINDNGYWNIDMFEGCSDDIPIISGYAKTLELAKLDSIRYLKIYLENLLKDLNNIK